MGLEFPLMEDAAGGYTYVDALQAGHVLEELGYRPIQIHEVREDRRK